MTTVAKLLAQKAAFEPQIEAARKADNSEATSIAKAIVDEFNLTKEDVSGAKHARKASIGSKVAPK